MAISPGQKTISAAQYQWYWKEWNQAFTANPAKNQSTAAKSSQGRGRHAELVIGNGGSSSWRISLTHHSGAIHANGQIPSGGNAAQSNTDPTMAWPNVELYQDFSD